MTTLDLAALAAHVAALHLPLRMEHSGMSVYVYDGLDRIVTFIDWPSSEESALLSLACAAPALLAEVGRLKTEVEALRSRLRSELTASDAEIDEVLARTATDSGGGQ